MTGSDPSTTSSLWTLKTQELLHPERFDLTKLKEIIESRGGSCEEMSTMNDITKLYNDLVLPKPQRKYNVNTKLGLRLHESQSKMQQTGRRQMEEVSMEVDLQPGHQIREENTKKRSHNGSVGTPIKTARASNDETEPVVKKPKNEIKWP